MRIKLLGLVAVAAILNACAGNKIETNKPDGQVHYQVEMQPGVSRYILKPEEASADIEILEHAAPRYPASVLHLSLPRREVRVRVIVNNVGSVSDVRNLNDKYVTYDDLFFSSVKLAVEKWKYTPLVISDWRTEGERAIRVGSRVVPFSMDYAFFFSVKNGAPVVSTKREMNEK